MPLRGESVGTAYIRIVADGTGVPNDIRDAFNDTDEHEIEAIGERHGKAYEKGLKHTFEESKDLHLSSVLERAIGMNKGTNDFFSKSEFWKNFKADAREEFGALGALGAEEIEAKFRRKGSLTGIDNEVEGFVGRMSKLRDALASERAKAASDAEKAMTDFEKKFRATMVETDQLYARSKIISKDALESTRRSFEDLGKSVFHSGKQMGLDLEKFQRQTKKTGREAVTEFGRLGRVIDELAVKTGRAFGKGSRNNFLNFTGSFIQGATGLLGVFPKVLDNIGQFGIGFKNAFNDSKGFFGAISNGFTEMSKDAEGAGTALSESFSSVVIAAPIVIAALLGIVQILGIVAALASGITAALIALASTISFGLVGAIVPLLGLLGPLALGFIGVAIAIGVMDRKGQQALRNSIRPILDAVKELGKEVRAGFGSSFDGGFAKIEATLGRMKELFRQIGVGLGQSANIFVSALNSSGFANFANIMGNVIPEVFRRLSRITVNLGSVLGTLFIDALPFTRKFLTSVEQITQNWADFLSQNPDRVRKFFREATGSAKVLLDFLGSVSSLIGTLFSGGRKTGNNLFKDLTKNIQQFADFLKPKGGKTIFDEQAGGIRQVKTSLDGLPKTNPLESFFKNGEKTAQQIGEIAVQVGKLFGELDSPESRSALHVVLGLSVNLIKGAVKIVNFVSKFVKATEFILSGLGNAARFVVRQFDRVVGAIDRIGNIGRGFNPFSAITRAANNISFNGVIHAAAQAVLEIIGHFNPIPTRLIGIAGRFGLAAARWADSIMAEIIKLPGRILSVFAGLGSAIARAIGDIVVNVVVNGPKSLLAAGGDLITHPLGHAAGGIITRPELSWIGEAGPEAVIPLTGPLSQVDSSVRELSAIARGLRGGSVGSSTVNTPVGKTVNVEQHITTLATDPVAAAQEFLNHLTAQVA